MPEAAQITYSLKELTELMLRDQGIRSGLWTIWIRFAFAATNIQPAEPGAASGPAGPGVVSVLTEAGIQKASEPGPLTVDASQIWEEQKAKRKPIVVGTSGKRKR